LERDLVRQIKDSGQHKKNDAQRETELQKNIKPKVVTNIDGARNLKKMEHREKQREVEKAQ